MDTATFLGSGHPPLSRLCASRDSNVARHARTPLHALAGPPLYRALDDREFQRTEPSYTFDTLQALASDLQEAVCCFIMGVDAFLEFESWHRWREVLELANFIVMERPGWEPPAERPDWWQEARIDSAAELGRKRGGQVLELTVEPRAVSATEIRYGIANGADVSPMLPPAVWHYIREHRLYRSR